MHPSDDPDLVKTELRTTFRNQRQALAKSQVEEASLVVAQQLRTLIGPADVVGFYAGVRGEISVQPEQIGTENAAFPRVDGPGEMTFRAPTNDLVAGSYGIPEPDESAPAVTPAELDALLVPGVAFTRSGIRLGQGGGFYDRFIPKMRPDAPRIGLCHSWQVVDDLPAEPHDVRVTHVVTEKETFVTGA